MFPLRRFARATPPRVARWFCACALVAGPAIAQSASGPVYEGRSSLGPSSRAAWIERVDRARAGYEAFAAAARLALHPKVIEPGVAPRPSGFLDDPTLRRGDVIVTSQGLMVFRGSTRFPRTFGDFDPVRSPAASAAGHAPELIELQRAHERGTR